MHQLSCRLARPNERFHRTVGTFTCSGAAQEVERGIPQGRAAEAPPSGGGRVGSAGSGEVLGVEAPKMKSIPYRIPTGRDGIKTPKCFKKKMVVLFHGSNGL